MKIGIFTALFGDKTLDETLDIVVSEGIEAVEFGSGAYPGASHIEVEKLLESKAERDKLPKDGKFKRALKGLLLKHKIDNNSTIQLKNTFLDCVDKMSGFTWHLHPNYDLAILKFNDFTKVICDEYPKFKKDTSDIKQGEFLCRLGFPFTEFTNFKFNDQVEDIEWTKDGVNVSPRFPIEGMITRLQRDYALEENF